jgi:uncharacterized protein YlxW (UPF0749 family)
LLQNILLSPGAAEVSTLETTESGWLQEDAAGSGPDQHNEVAQLREEIRILQDTVESANKDLQDAEAHANEMQARCDTATGP